ncbi:hypothetical protein PWT90_02211 [Aphanocladium album]|nr:hypothetical protein PWT90_02211 [Aphanocladium album]
MVSFNSSHLLDMSSSIYNNQQTMQRDSSSSPASSASSCESSGELSLPAQSKRRRNWAPKVRTGCLTCRNDFNEYAASASSRKRQCSVPTSRAPSTSPTPSKIQATARQWQIYDLFRSLTVKQIGGVLSKSSFWSVDLLQATEAYPVIFHSSLAMAALNHQLRMSHIAVEAKKEYFEFALQEYDTAIQELVQLAMKTTLTYCDKEAILLANVLFTGIACLQGNLDQALVPVRKTLQLFNEWNFSRETVVAARGAPRQGVIDPSWLLHLISYFEFQAHDIDATIAATSWKRHAHELRAPPSSEGFASVADAYYEYMPLHFGFSVNANAALGPNSTSQQGGASGFENVSSRWRLRLQQLAEDTEEVSAAQRRALSTLWLLVKCERLCRHVRRSSDPEIWRTSNVEFREIVDSAEKLLQGEYGVGGGEDCDVIAPTFTFSLSAVEALRLVGFVSRNGAIRRRVIELLRTYQRRDGLWDSKLSSSLIEARMMLDENTLQDLGEHRTCACEENVFMCKEHRALTLGGEMVGIKMFRTSINSRAGQLRGDQDVHVCTEWE